MFVLILEHMSERALVLTAAKRRPEMEIVLMGTEFDDTSNVILVTTPVVYARLLDNVNNVAVAVNTHF